MSLTTKQRTQLRRLSQAFKTPLLAAEFEDHMPYAVAAYEAADYKISCWNAWLAAIAKTATIAMHGRMGNRIVSHPSRELIHVVKRGKCFAPVTSGVEQSFAKIAQRLGPQRLNASSKAEARTIGLLVADLTDHEVEGLAAAAREIWKVAFPNAHCRQHVRTRVDARLRRDTKPRVAGVLASVDGATSRPTERRFLKRLHSSVAASSTRGDAAALDTFKPTVWDDSHTKEVEFQRVKVRKRMVEAPYELLILRLSR